MIIRLSVKDNDFQDKLSKYASKLFINIDEDGVELTTENAVEKWETSKRINQILNPNIHKEWTSEDEKFLEEQIRKSFAYFCETHCQKNKDYLTSNLTISFMESMTDKWENGEACYWFQNSGSIIVQ